MIVFLLFPEDPECRISVELENNTFEIKGEGLHICKEDLDKDSINNEMRNAFKGLNLPDPILIKVHDRIETVKKPIYAPMMNMGFLVSEKILNILFEKRRRNR